MTIAFDAYTSNTGSVQSPSFTHTPVGTPRGVLVFITRHLSAVDTITGVTYGGTAMAEVTNSPLLATGETAEVHCFFLGTSIPTGAQTVAVTGTTTLNTGASCITVTAAGDTEFNNSNTLNTIIGNPSLSLTLGSIESFVAQAFRSGRANTDITALTNWTERLEQVFGSQLSGLYAYDIIGTTDVTCGYTSGSDDAGILAVAINEIASGVTITDVYWDPETDWDYAVYDGGVIPSNSIMFYETGAHNGAVNASALSVSGASWTIDEWVGFLVKNTTDGSEAVITANTATTITATLAGGTDNDWDVSDVYEIVLDIDVNDQIIYDTVTDLSGTVAGMTTKGVPTISGSSGSHSFDVKYRDVTDSKVSATTTVTITV